MPWQYSGTMATWRRTYPRIHWSCCFAYSTGELTTVNHKLLCECEKLELEGSSRSSPNFPLYWSSEGAPVHSKAMTVQSKNPRLSWIVLLKWGSWSWWTWMDPVMNQLNGLRSVLKKKNRKENIRAQQKLSHVVKISNVLLNFCFGYAYQFGKCCGRLIN